MKICSDGHNEIAYEDGKYDGCPACYAMQLKDLEIIKLKNLLKELSLDADKVLKDLEKLK